jgi:hypothetical protein
LVITEGPIGVLPNSFSSVSSHPLKLIEYPPNAFFFAILILLLVDGDERRPVLTPGVLLPQVRGGKKKKPHR